MVHASLFTGIGGFDLAAEWCGWDNSFQCEIDPFCQKVLAKNFPHADRHTDIKQFNAKSYAGRIDVLSGGFPCQPFSLAGQRKGNSDDRALWPQMLRVIDEVRPRWIVGENVAGLASLGLDSVLFDLEASGYTAETVLLPACGVGAPHRRDRLWIVAHASGGPPKRRRELGGLGSASGEERSSLRDAACRGCTVTTNASSHTGRRARPLESKEWEETARRSPKAIAYANGGECDRQQSAAEQARRLGPASALWRLTEPPLCGPNDGLPAGLVRISTRAKQLKAYGNSIVPQVAYEIFQAIASIDAPPSPTSPL